jgi:hypothetical protein
MFAFNVASLPHHSATTTVQHALALCNPNKSCQLCPLTYPNCSNLIGRPPLQNPKQEQTPFPISLKSPYHHIFHPHKCYTPSNTLTFPHTTTTQTPTLTNNHSTHTTNNKPSHPAQVQPPFPNITLLPKLPLPYNLHPNSLPKDHPSTDHLTLLFHIPPKLTKPHPNKPHPLFLASPEKRVPTTSLPYATHSRLPG